MLSKADNEFLTRAGKDTPMGALLRRFWMPALLSEELPEPPSDEEVERIAKRLHAPSAEKDTLPLEGE